MSRIAKRTLAVLSVILFCQSCFRDPALLPPPIPFPIQSIEQTPFRSFLDSMHRLLNTDELAIISVTINSPFFPHQELPGQAVIGYSFRSSVPGKITSLGIYLPARGF